jgi:hypothetical protein
MKKQALFISLVLIAASQAMAQEERYAAAFLDIPLGVRALGVGGQFTPIDNKDGSAFFWNPSALALIKGKYISTMYSNQFGSIGNPLSNYFHIGYSQDLGPGIGVSLNWIRNSIANIPLTDEPTGARGDYFRQIRAGILDNNGATFSNNDDALFLSVAKTIINIVDFGWQYFRLPIEIPLGVTFKYVSQSFGGDRRVSFSGNGIGVDIGTLIKFKFSDFVGKQLFGDFVFGVTVKDLFNTTIAWNTDLRTRAAIPRSLLDSCLLQATFRISLKCHHCAYYARYQIRRADFVRRRVSLSRYFGIAHRQLRPQPYAGRRAVPLSRLLH